MNLSRTLRYFVIRRRAMKLFERLVIAHEASADALLRLADRYAPKPLVVDAADLKDTGPSFNRDRDHARIQDFVDRCWKDLQREPTDEEIVRFLDGEEMRL